MTPCVVCDRCEEGRCVPTTAGAGERAGERAGAGGTSATTAS